jgi:hypothetical protein
VDESQTPQSERSRAGRTLISYGVVLAAATLVIALFVVVRNFRNVKPEPLPPALKTIPPDTALVAFRAGIRRKVMNLSARCRSKRKQLGKGMTPLEDSLSRECDSAIAFVLDRIAALDTVRRENRKTAADSVKSEYERAKLSVRVFVRTAMDRDTISEDSLNREINRLISE